MLTLFLKHISTSFNMEDYDLSPCKGLLDSEWLQFRCIHCIQKKCPYDNLMKPIELSFERVGLNTIVTGICCNGHKLDISPHNTIQTQRLIELILLPTGFNSPATNWSKRSCARTKLMNYICVFLVVVSCSCQS